MKKYLMMGALALTVATAFVSCSKEKDLYDPTMNAQKFLQDYQQAFISVFGQPSANQTWGFDANATRATRANNGENYPATHSYTDANGNVIAGANMNHNQWGSTDLQSMPYGGWIVPDPLTDKQKAVVAAFFQTVTDIDYEDPHFRHFFVQQTYKGGNQKVNNTTEGIAPAEENVYYTSGNMNLMTVGQYNSHINDFNAGTCSSSTVLYHNGETGKDQITLMVNVDDTSCFGYHETGSSTHHNDKAALVSWEVIDEWARTNYTGYDGCLKDDWNRSFLGFDLAIREGAQAYATDQDGNVLYATYNQAPTAPIYGWDGENIVEMGTFHTVQHSEYWIEKVFDGYKDEYKNIMKAGEPIGWLTTNENFYVAESFVTLTGEANAGEREITEVYSDDVLVFKDVKVEGAPNNKAHVINLKRIKELVDAGYLPVMNKSLTEWVQVGVSDGYYSDWIVTLTEAQRIPEPGNPVIRVFGEDLSATEASDFDFNDVVFDAEKISDTEIMITVWAAGGTLPLRIYGKYESEAKEVHAELGTNTNCMTNTHAKEWAKYGNTWADNKLNNKPAVFNITVEDMDTYNDGIYADNFPLAVRDLVKVEVYKGEGEEAGWYELSANKGVPTCKIACSDLSVKWVKERVQLKDVYPLFQQYVGTGYPTNWWSTIQQEDALYAPHGNGQTVSCEESECSEFFYVDE